MKPAAFAYLAPHDLDEALDQLAEHGADARVLAGGQSLVRLMNARLASPAVVVDINRVGGLDALSLVNGSGPARLRLGATVRQRTSELSPEVAAHAPLLAEAGAHVAHAPVRSRGTVVGSVAFADPSAELPTALLALDGRVVARSRSGERTIEADDFFTGPFTTSLAPGELVVAVEVPVTAAGTGTAFVEVSRRHGDLPVCGVAATVTRGDDGSVAATRIALCGAGERPVRARAAEDALTGSDGGADAVAAAAARAADGLSPIADCHGSADFRRHLARVLTGRALRTAIHRAAGEADNA
ncbi:carbon monoxide dehydrogenase [Pseudonocardia sulfidoxydans NBRC 16205]|uniref:Carbon monoxide dehydrogenase n=1 Tax=Pseudonocardia sulfidoxydans NBRC 16205 TaxID=1223511 RepID=A0A511D9L7_9PSEU|nr:xanthine dehydrogenase family protein subunit M [Pseudonocardia sulfidoxydans]GEL21505.1 carbon monoxide dehydrogenase [Pseudonocardia sulfidoxydans NBRC 16205]